MTNKTARQPSILVTFDKGQDQVVGGKKFDSECVASYQGELQWAKHIFPGGIRRAFFSHEWMGPEIKRFPRGYVQVPSSAVRPFDLGGYTPLAIQMPPAGPVLALWHDGDVMVMRGEDITSGGFVLGWAPVPAVPQWIIDEQKAA